MEEKTRKKRNLLEFYGVKKKHVDLVDESRRADPLDLDNAAFNTELYLSKYLYEVSLADLIRRDNDLVMEIKELDGDMKTLVYENYSKFISAAETIKKMKSNVDSLEERFHKLNNSIDTIDNTAKSIHDTFKVERTRIRELSTVNDLLKKLNFVFDLPSKLQTSNRKKNYAEAVQLYAKSYDLLSHYGQLPMFKKIADESHSIINDVSKKIYEKLYKTNTIKDVTDQVILLLQIKNEKLENLAKSYLKASTDILTKILDSDVKLTIKEGSPLLSNMSPVKESALSPIKEDPKESPLQLSPKKEELFQNLAPSMKNALQRIFYYNQHFLTELNQSATNFVELFLNETVDEQIRKALDLDHSQQVKNMTKRYFELVEKSLEIPNDLSKIIPQSYVFVLDHLQSEMTRFDALKNLFKIDMKMVDLTNDILAKIVGSGFNRTFNEFFNKLKQVDLQNLLASSSSLTEWIEKALIEDCLPMFKNFVFSDNSFSAETEDLLVQIENGLEDFWFKLFEEMMNQTSDEKLILLLSHIVYSLRTKSITKIYNSFMTALFKNWKEPPVKRPSRSQTIVTASGGAYGYSNRKTSQMPANVHPLMKRAFEISDHCQDVAKQLTKEFVFCYSNQICRQFRIFYRNDFLQLFGEQTEPENVSLIWIQILSKLHELRRLAHSLFPDESAAKKTFKKNGSPRGKDPSLNNIDKLFADKLTYLGQVELKASDIMAAIVKLILKCMVEEVRLMKLGPMQFKQIHVDMEYCRIALADLQVDIETFSTLIDEALNSASTRRTGEYDLLSTEHLQHILQKCRR